MKDALKIYNCFHLLRRAPSWGDICVSCNCRVRFANCVCGDSLLFVSLFKPAVRVPHAWIGTTPSLRKRCRSIKGSPERKRLRLIAEGQCDEKVIYSKVTYLQGSRQSPALPSELSIPFPVLPTSSSSESDDDDFVNVKVRMASWAAPGLSVLTKYVVRRSSRSSCGRGSPAARRDRPSHPLVSLPLHLLFVLRRPLVDRQANHRLRRRLRNCAQQRNHGYAHASFFSGARTVSPEMTLFPSHPGKKLARPRGGLRNGLRNVEVARPSPSRRLQITLFTTPLFRISRNFQTFLSSAQPSPRPLRSNC